MCLRTLASLLVLSLLPGCVNSGYLVTSLAADPWQSHSRRRRR